MKRYAIRLTPVVALTLVACGASVSKHPAEGVSATVPAQTSNTTDRKTFRDDQSAAPRVDNAPIDP
jgi:outer membrane biogenesis lipoprotein LolB